MSLEITLLSAEQRETVEAAIEGFTCRGPRHQDDPTVELGDSFMHDGTWVHLDRHGLTRTWAATLDGEFAGYIALASDAVKLTNSERRQAAIGDEASFSRCGCVQIAMVAVRADIQARDDVHVGRILIEHAQYVGREIGRSLGARFLVAYVNPPAQGFYERCGFVSLRSRAAKDRAGSNIPMMLDLWPPIAKQEC